MSVAGLRRLAFIGLFLFSGLSVAQTVPRILITKPVDESQLTVLKGNTHPSARAEFDRVHRIQEGNRYLSDRGAARLRAA